MAFDLQDRHLTDVVEGQHQTLYFASVMSQGPRRQVGGQRRPVPQLPRPSAIPFFARADLQLLDWSM